MVLKNDNWLGFFKSLSVLHKGPEGMVVLELLPLRTLKCGHSCSFKEHSASFSYPTLCTSAPLHFSAGNIVFIKRYTQFGGNNESVAYKSVLHLEYITVPLNLPFLLPSGYLS